jgi:hypothetical protein
LIVPVTALDLTGRFPDPQAARTLVANTSAINREKRTIGRILSQGGFPK